MRRKWLEKAVQRFVKDYGDTIIALDRDDRGIPVKWCEHKRLEDRCSLNHYMTVPKASLTSATTGNTKTNDAKSGSEDELKEAADE